MGRNASSWLSYFLAILNWQALNHLSLSAPFSLHLSLWLTLPVLGMLTQKKHCHTYLQLPTPVLCMNGCEERLHTLPQSNHSNHNMPQVLWQSYNGGILWELHEYRRVCNHTGRVDQEGLHGRSDVETDPWVSQKKNLGWGGGRGTRYRKYKQGKGAFSLFPFLSITFNVLLGIFCSSSCSLTIKYSLSPSSWN